MTGQLNTNLLNSNSEEIQEELDTLSNRLDGVESVTSANTDKINEVDNKVDNLANCVSTDSLNATNVAVCNIQGSSATITDINANNITVCNKIKATNIEADNITGTINGNVSANTIDAATANIAAANVTEKIMAASAEITDVNATNANITNGNISALCAEGITTTGTITSQNVCVKVDINVDGCIIGPKKITTPVSGSVQSGTISGCTVFGTYVKAKDCLRSPEIYGNIINMGQAYFKNASISNLKVSCSLELADGITLPNTLGDTTLTSVTTDKLTVNGDTELNGAVKACSVTIGDGSITAGEVCIGAKGIVIDKDKNATLADITANTVTAGAATISGKVTAACTESTDIVSTNVFAKNLYPENITIDKNVGDLHYSRQLDTDAVGAVLVDCKSITPVEVTHSLFPKNGYIETETSAVETTYAKNKALKYSKRGNGLSVSSTVYRPDVCHSSYKTAVKFITGCSDPGITGCCGKGFTVENNGANGLSVSYFYDNCHCPFIDYNFCDTNKNTSTVIGSCSLDVTSKNINVKNISTCSVSDDNKVLKVDNCGNVYSGKITSSLIGSDCACYNDCTLRFSCIYQNPSRQFYYCINNETEGSYCRVCQEMSCCAAKQCIIYCCYCTDNPYDSQGRCFCTLIDTYTNLTEKRKWCCDWNRNTNEQFECIIDETETRNLGCPITNCVMFKKCCCNGNDPTKNTCVCYWDYTYNGLGGRYNSTYPDYNPRASYFCRYVDGHPELGWCFSICDNNLKIVNPQNDNKDILRVEDGKIYTKCGEFKAGGGSVFDNSSATICDNFATYNLGHSVCTCERTVKISTSITCAAENCCPITFSYGYNGQNPYILAETGYDGTLIDLPRASICFSNSNGDVVANVPTFYCSHCQEGDCIANITCDTLNKTCSYDGCCGFITKKGVAFDIPEWMNWRNLCGDPVEIGCYYSRNGNETKCLVYCVPFIGTKYSSLDCDYISDCACYDVPHYIFNASYDFSNYKDCTWTENKLIETCTYTSRPVVLKYSKQQVDVCWECYYCPSCGNDQWQPKAYRCPQSDTCFYPVENGYRIDTTSSGCYQSKITANTIANLPITNTLVPLAGKVNGKGFAFFCKGSDGIKFYDSAFATVDAGSATDITYLVTTGV